MYRRSLTIVTLVYLGDVLGEVAQHATLVVVLHLALQPARACLHDVDAPDVLYTVHTVMRYWV